MISKYAIKEFRSRRLNDWSWIKDASRSDLLYKIKEMSPKLRFINKPRTHQLASILVGIHERDFLFYLDMGTGKSYIILSVISHWKLHGVLNKHSLVVVPAPVNISDFAVQVKTHSTLTFTEAYGSSKERWDMLNNLNTDLFIINYAGLMAMITDSGKDGLVINKKKLSAFTKHFGLVVFDECHMFKNKDTLTFRMCRAISKRVEFKYGMTGTPMGRDPLDLWAQFYVIDGGETLGKHYTLFKEAFFLPHESLWKLEWKVNPKFLYRLHRTLRHKSLRYEESEVNDLPERVYINKEFKLPFRNKQIYNNAVEGVIEAHGNFEELNAVFTRLRQICSGFVGYSTEDGDKSIIDFDYNPKLELLMEIIDDINTDRKIVIFHEFIHSGDIIEKALRSRKIKFSRLYGGTKDKKGARDAFINDKHCRVFLVNLSSGGTGLNLQVANYVIYFENTADPIVRRQSEKRVHRDGQKRRVYIIDLTVSNSVETDILDYLKEGKNMFRVLVEGKINLRGL